jgi:exonuclease III
MAFRKKAENILKYDPDIMVILESESKEKIDFIKHSKFPHQIIWDGGNANKGLLIASYNKDYDIKINDLYNKNFKYVLPIDIITKEHKFLLLAVWAKNTSNPFTSYVVQVSRAVNFYKNLLNEKTIIIGDFNSNKIWDNVNKKEANHSDLVRSLEALNIQSLYHNITKLDQGKETEPTFYLHKKRDKPYHIDYLFVGNFWLEKLTKLEIGNFDDWIKHSDHMPIMGQFEV